MESGIEIFLKSARNIAPKQREKLSKRPECSPMRDWTGPLTNVVDGGFKLSLSCPPLQPHIRRSVKNLWMFVSFPQHCVWFNDGYCHKGELLFKVVQNATKKELNGTQRIGL